MKKVKKQKLHLKKYQAYVNKKVAGICAITILVSTILGPLATSANTENNTISPDPETQVIADEGINFAVEETEVQQENVEEGITIVEEEPAPEEEPKEEVTAEEPKEEEPKEEAPTVEEPKEEAPAPEEPKEEAPTVEEPKEEAPAPEEPKEEAPTVEEPKEEAPTVEEPKEEAPAPEEPKEEAPAPEEPKEEAPTVEEPKEEAPTVEEPKEEAPAPEEPKEEAPEQVEESQVNEEEEQADIVEYTQLALDSRSGKLPFPVTIRDFKADGLLFEGKNDSKSKDFTDQYSITSGLVEGIGNDGKPILSIRGMNYLISKCADKTAAAETQKICKGLSYIEDTDTAKLNQVREYYETIKSVSYTNLNSELQKQIPEEYRGYVYLLYHFNTLFNDVSGFNHKVNQVSSINLDMQKGGSYKYSSTSFFPIDDYNIFKDEEEEYKDKSNNPHDFHFTLESHTLFWFEEGEELKFDFRGDDDVWVFLNGHQVIDLGGMHDPRNQSFKINKDGTVTIMYYHAGTTVQETETISCGIEGSGWYKFDFFYMERHTKGSNLIVSTNMEFRPSIDVQKIAYKYDETGNTQVPLTEDSVVYPGEKIYYKFKISNQGNMDIKDIEVVDDLIGLKIFKPDESDKYIIETNTSDVPLTKQQYSIIKRDTDYPDAEDPALEDPELDDYFSLLKYSTKESLEIESPYFYYIVPQYDNSKPYVFNAVTVKASTVPINELYPSETVEATGTSNINVNPTQLYLKKIVLTKENVSQHVSDLFYIKISGNDGSEYNIPVSTTKETIVNVLKIGVDYTISEIVPMNYSLSGMTGSLGIFDNNVYNFRFECIPDNNGQLKVTERVEITNIQGPDKWFKDDALKQNVFQF